MREASAREAVRAGKALTFPAPAFRCSPGVHSAALVSSSAAEAFQRWGPALSFARPMRWPRVNTSLKGYAQGTAWFPRSRRTERLAQPSGVAVWRHVSSSDLSEQFAHPRPSATHRAAHLHQWGVRQRAMNEAPSLGACSD